MTFARTRTDHDWINVYSGTRFHPFDPQPHEIHLVDIAHALGRACRYAGHTPMHYSVAEHAVHASKVVELLGGSIEEQRWALLHDATEAYLVDLPSPIKNHPGYAFYVEHEDVIMEAIANRFGLHQTTMPLVVKQADKAMLFIEVGSGFIINKMHPDFSWAIPVYGKNIDPVLEGKIKVQNLDADKATALFLQTFHKLFEGTPFQKEALEAAHQRGIILDGVEGKMGALIGIGHRKRSGKDTAAKILMEGNPMVKRVAFADLLKAGVNLWHGWDERHSDGDLKEVVDPYYGYSPRYAYVNIGTDCIRDHHSRTFWVDCALRVARKWRAAGYDVVITDVRFPNEADMIKAEGGVVWKTDRPSMPPLDMENDHVSETAMANYEGWDEVLVNTYDGGDDKVANTKAMEDFRGKVFVAYAKHTVSAALKDA